MSTQPDFPFDAAELPESNADANESSPERRSSARVRAPLRFAEWVKSHVAELPAVVAAIWAVALVVDGNLYFSRPNAAWLSYDEAYASALARRMVEGHYLPYVDGVSHRGPVFYWVLAISVRLFGTGTWLPMRIVSVVSMLATAVFGILAAAFAGRFRAGALAAICLAAVWLVDLAPPDGLGCNSETVVSAFAMAALFSVVVACRSTASRRRVVWAAAAGALAMLSALSKQVACVLVVPIGLWIVAECFAAEKSGAEKPWRPLVGYAVGAFAPLAIVLLRYAIAGELRTFFYYAVTYNTSVYGAALQGPDRIRSLRDAFLGHAEILILAAPAFGWALTRFITSGQRFSERIARYAASGFDSTVALSFAATLLVSNASLRNFPHYYLIVLPWAALLGGVLLERAVSGTNESPSRLRAFATGVLLFLPIVAVTQLGWRCRAEDYRSNRAIQDAFHTQDWPVCRFLKEKTTKNDSIFFWGFDAAPYTACDRRSASRYVFTTFPAGYVPWVEAPRAVEDARVAPNSRRILIDELTREKPAMIFDSPRSMAGRSLLQYDFLRDYVVKNYDRLTDMFGPTVWVRKQNPKR